MPASSPPVGAALKKLLRYFGQRLRAHRKRLGVNATVTAESAGMSRVTLHRIERGEPSVTMGAYLSVISALGLELELFDPQQKRTSRSSAPKLPSKVRLTDFPQLKRLAWQMKDTQEISPKEALDLYERNWRHVDLAKMDSHEREFIETLLAAFGRERLLV
ncbi:helix-turn-helix transcriptional regulator [Bdellovibrionota bacterium FG-1]